MLIVGCGHIGLVLVRNLMKTMSTAKITVVHSNLEKVKEVTSYGANLIQLNISEYDKLISMLKGFDLAVGLAPGKLGYRTVKACIETGVNMVDGPSITISSDSSSLTSCILDEDVDEAVHPVCKECGGTPPTTA